MARFADLSENELSFLLHDKDAELSNHKLYLKIVYYTSMICNIEISVIAGKLNIEVIFTH